MSWDPGTGAPRNTIASRSRGVLESLNSVSFHSLALWLSLQPTSSASPVPKSVCPQFEMDPRGCVPTPNAPSGWSSTPGPINQGQRVALQGTATALLGPSPVHGRRSHSRDWRTEPDQYPKMGLLQAGHRVFQHFLPSHSTTCPYSSSTGCPQISTHNPGHSF